MTMITGSFMFIAWIFSTDDKIPIIYFTKHGHLVVK